MAKNRMMEPNSSKNEVPTHEIASPGAGEVRTIRILCVDDDTIGLQLRGEVLRRHGYEVTLDSSPMQALHRDLLAFDLAIIDYEMPGLNGVELLFAMRAMHVAYPIILLSGGLGNLDAVQQRLFYRCLEKGRPVETLLAAIESYVQFSKLPDFEDDRTPKYRPWMLR